MPHRGSQTAIFLPDALGSVRQITSSGGMVTLTQSFDPFGNPLGGMGIDKTSYGFAGEWTDGTGLQFLRARYYAPTQGRFISKDPFFGMLEQPQTINPYVYVLNNPIRFTDPSGKFLFIPLMLTALAGGLIGGLAYYAWQVYHSTDPCAKWDWTQAALWGGAGFILGGGLGLGIYGGWWLGAQLGLWNSGGIIIPRVVQEAIQWAQNNPNKISHIFDNPEHNWNLTGQELTGNWALIEQTILENYENIISNPTAFQVSKVFDDFTVFVYGAVVNGAIRIGTAFISKIP